MIPAVVETASDTPTPTAAPAMAAASSRRPLISPIARPIIAAGKITSMPSRSGSTIDFAEKRAGEAREEPRDEGDADCGEPVADRIEPPEPAEVSDRQRERLVGQDVRRERALTE